MNDLLSDALSEHQALFGRLSAMSPLIEKAAALIISALSAGHKLLLCGNGGSAADSQHIAAELIGRFVAERRALSAVALSTDTSALTSIANDYGFEEVFARQLAAVGGAGDCLLAISTSGNSENVFRAAKAARAAGIHMIGLLGRDGGRILPLCDVALVVPSRTTARIQEAHIFIGHALCAMIDHGMGFGAV
ncbi:MAG: D-sedoheptulose-7-phosphate isomerase [Steroidobacteraceae bacterium]